MSQNQSVSDSCVRVTDTTVVIDNFREDDPKVVQLLRHVDNPIEAVHQILQVGGAALSLSTDRINTELIDAKFRNMTAIMDTNLERTGREIRGALDAIVSGDQAAFPNMLKSAEERISTLLADTFDPESTRSAIASMTKVFVEAREQQLAAISELVNDAEDGPLGKLNHSLTSEVRRVADDISGDVSRILEQIAHKKGATEERFKSAGKGHDFEEQVVDAVAGLSPTLGGISEQVGHIPGTTGGRQGDVLVSLVGGPGSRSEARVIIEAKAKPMALRAILEELDEGKENRGAHAAIAVFQNQDISPTAVPFQQYDDKAIVVFDGQNDAALQVGMIWGQMKALTASESFSGDGFDLERIGMLFEKARLQLERFSTLRGHHTASKNALDKASGLVSEMQTELRAVLDDLSGELHGDLA